MRRHSLTCLSAFTGAGGLDLGMEAAGFATIGCIDSDPVCRQTIQQNRPEWPLIRPFDVCEAAHVVGPTDLGVRRRELDLLAGGPPCQPFSMAAQWTAAGRNGLNDHRSVAIDGFVDLIESFLPRAILIENVPGFAAGRTNAVPYLQHCLRQINTKNKTKYRLEYRIVNAADFGVPQTRRRAIIVAFRNSQKMPWPVSTHADTHTRAGDVLSDDLIGDEIQPAGQWHRLLPSIPEGWNYIWHTERGGGLRLFGYRTKYWSFLLKLSRELPSWTLPASPGPSTGPFHWSNRPLSVAERLLLQSFPKKWALSGSVRDQIRQAGNATPPLLAEHLGRSIAYALTKESVDRRPRFHVAKKQKLPQKIRRKPVPKEYMRLVDDHAPHPGTGLGPKPIVRKSA